MSVLDELSPIARHAIWVACMDSNVPVQVAEPVTIERVTTLLRSSTHAQNETRARNTRVPVFSDNNIFTSESACQSTPNGPLMGSVPL